MKSLEVRQVIWIFHMEVLHKHVFVILLLDFHKYQKKLSFCIIARNCITFKKWPIFQGKE